MRIALVLALLAAPAMVVAQSPAVPRRAEIDSLNRAMERAYARGDLRAVAAFYSDDAVMIGPLGDRIAGREKIDEHWTRIHEPRSWRLELETVGGSRDDVYQLARSTMTYGSRNPREHSTVMCFIVWRRQRDGTLRIVLDMYTDRA